MKICVISNLYSPYVVGGAEINSERLVKALKPTYDVFVITTQPFKGLKSLVPSKEKRQAINVYRFYPLNLYHLYFSKKRKIPSFVKVMWHCIDLFNIHTFLVVLFILKKEKPSVVHTNNLDGMSFSVFWAVKVLGIPLVHTLHDYHLLCPYANLVCFRSKFNVCKRRPFICSFYSFLKKRITGTLPDVAIGPSKFIVNMHKRHGFFGKIITKKIPYFVEDNERRQISNNKETFDILYIGNISRSKGVDILLRAFVQCSGWFLRLHIVGDGPYVKKLKRHIQKDHRITYYGIRPHTGTETFYRNADALIVPSVWYDNFPTVILEAFSFGLPVIASRIGGIPEQVQEGYNGIMVVPGDVEDLKKKIDLLTDDFNRYKTVLKGLSEGAFASYQQCYRKEDVVRNTVAIYSSLLEKNDAH